MIPLRSWNLTNISFETWWLEDDLLSFLGFGNFSGGQTVKLQVGRHPNTCKGLVWINSPKKRLLRQKAFRGSFRTEKHQECRGFWWILDVSAVHGIGLHSTLTPNLIFTTLTSNHIPPKPKGFIKKCPSTTISELCSNVIGSMGLVYKTYIKINQSWR